MVSGCLCSPVGEAGAGGQGGRVLGPGTRSRTGSSAANWSRGPGRVSRRAGPGGEVWINLTSGDYHGVIAAARAGADAAPIRGVTTQLAAQEAKRGRGSGTVAYATLIEGGRRAMPVRSRRVKYRALGNHGLHQQAT